MICVTLYALSWTADIVQCNIHAAIQIKPLLSDGLLYDELSYTTAS